MIPQDRSGCSKFKLYCRDIIRPLEWGDERTESPEALSVSRDKPDTEIILGLLSSKMRTPNDEARIIRLLDEASKIIDKNRRLLSHQCGFVFCGGGNELIEEEQWAKIDQGQRIAQKCWGV